MALIEKIKPSQTARWPYNISVGTVSVADDMRAWLIEAHGHGDVFMEDNAQNWLSAETDEPDHGDIVYFLWGPGYIQFKHEEDMLAFVLRFSG